MNEVWILDDEQDGLLGVFTTAEAGKQWCEGDDTWAPSDYFGKPIVWKDKPVNPDYLMGHYHDGPHTKRTIVLSKEVVKA